MTTLRKQTSTSADIYSSDANRRLFVKLASKGIVGKHDSALWIPIKPDWHNDEKKVAAFLDGSPHESPKQREFDEAITVVLRRLHWKVKREPYKGRISEEKLNEVVGFIQDAMN